MTLLRTIVERASCGVQFYFCFFVLFSFFFGFCIFCLFLFACTVEVPSNFTVIVLVLDDDLSSLCWSEHLGRVIHQ